MKRKIDPSKTIFILAVIAIIVGIFSSMYILYYHAYEQKSCFQNCDYCQKMIEKQADKAPKTRYKSAQSIDK